jgi:hypothetical protein
MKQTVFILSFSLFVLLSSGQLHRFPDLYYDSGVNRVEVKGKNYRTSYKIDPVGRAVKKKNSLGKYPSSTTEYKYNNKGDVTAIIFINDINNPSKSDTIQYQYEYDGDKIASQTVISSSGNVTLYKLIGNKGDSTLVYEISTPLNVSDNKPSYQINGTLLLTYHNNLPTKEESIGLDSSKYTTIYEYYENGNVKRRVIKIFSTAALKPMLMGALEADDQTFKYSYDKKGRIRNHYLIRDGKKHKLFTYSYE